jgi:hypothetical protein
MKNRLKHGNNDVSKEGCSQPHLEFFRLGSTFLSVAFCYSASRPIKIGLFALHVHKTL